MMSPKGGIGEEPRALSEVHRAMALMRWAGQLGAATIRAAERAFDKWKRALEISTDRETAFDTTKSSWPSALERPVTTHPQVFFAVEKAAWKWASARRLETKTAQKRNKKKRKCGKRNNKKMKAAARRGADSTS